METQAGTADRARPSRASAWIGFFVVVALVVAGQAIVRAVRSDDGVPKPAVLSGTVMKPVSVSILNKYDVSVPAGVPAYVVASGGPGEAGGWFAVAYQTRDGKACFAFRGSVLASGCEPLGSSGSTVSLLGGDGLPTEPLVNYGIAAVAVRNVVFLTDSGRSWSTDAVRPGNADFRFFAVRARQVQTGALEVAWEKGGGRLERAETPLDPGLVLCTAAEPPRHGIPDGLPRAGATTLTHVMDVRGASGDELLRQYGATDLQAASRNGWVWRPTASGNETLPAADFLLRLYVPSASQCPGSPQSFDGVPLSFAIGPAPEAKQVYVTPLPSRD